MQIPHGTDEDSVEDTNVVDEMSVIPPETDYYFQYSPRTKEQVEYKGQQNLNELLESLDKSGFCQDQPVNAYYQEQSAGESSTTEEAQKPRSTSRERKKVSEKKVKGAFEIVNHKENSMMTPSDNKKLISLNVDGSYGQANKEPSSAKAKRCRTLERKAAESPQKKENPSEEYQGGNSEPKKIKKEFTSPCESPDKKQVAG